DQCSKMPARPPRATKTGSGIFRHSSKPKVTTAMALVGRSVTVWRVRTTTRPAIAPAAGGGGPLTEALVCGGGRAGTDQRPRTAHAQVNRREDRHGRYEGARQPGDQVADECRCNHHRPGRD